MKDRRHHLPEGKVIHLPGHDKAQPQEACGNAVAIPEPVNSLGATLQLVRAEAGAAALLVLRIREFRELAESFGDACGQQLSREISRRLAGCVRDSDQVLPLGAGEFAIVLPQPEDLEDVNLICERLVQSCAGHYQLEEVTPLVNAAIGIALYPADTNEVNDVERYAHIALRRAESGTGKDYHYFSREMLTRQRYRIWMEGELKRALSEDRFTLYYQPQYALDSHEIVGMEALVRLLTVEGEVIQPDDFIGIAEENSFIVDLGYWVIREACRQLAEWRQAGCGPDRIAVNVSPRQLLDSQLPDVIDQAIVDSGLLHLDLELEVTESCMLEYLPVTGDVLRKLREKGVRIAVDDFGAGYSSFATLAQLPLDIFKLDRSFMSNVSSDPRARHVVTAMIAMARELGYQVIAEGVETDQQYRFLQASGCDLGQGFGLARPQDAESVSRLLQTLDAAALVS